MASTENVGKMLIVLVVFIATVGLLLALQTTSQPAYTDQPNSVSTLINGISYTYLTPSAGHAYTWVNATDNMHNSRTAQTAGVHYYYPSDSNAAHVSIIRNRTDSQGWFQNSEWFKYRDFLGVEKSWGWWDYKGVAIPLSALTALHNASLSSNKVYYNVTLDRDYVVEVSTATAAGFTNSIYNDNAFTVKVSYVTIDPDVLNPSGDWWGAIWNFLTAVGALLFGFSMPGVPYLGILVSLGIWTGILYSFYMLVVRGIHGGG